MFLKHLVSLILQIILAVVIHDAVVKYYTTHTPEVHADVAWGLRLKSLSYDFILVVFTQNLLIIFFQKKHLIISILASLVYCLIVLPYYKHHPLRSIHLMTTGVWAIWAKYLFDYLFQLVFGKWQFGKNG